MQFPNPNHYDAILIVAFGGPEGMDEVIPFLENVLRGRPVSRERLLEVAEHYYAFGGVSPVNDHNRALIAALEAELQANGPQLPIYWGNRNWHPLLPDTLRQMRDDGIKKALAIFTTAYSSYASCRQYRENIAAAQEIVGPGAPQVDKIRAFYNHPGFIEAAFELVQHAFFTLPETQRDKAHIAFTAHSIPQAMAQHCRYEAQLQAVCELIAEGLNHPHWQLVFQSRSGPLSQPWLEPDICNHLQTLKGQGVRDVIVAPIGFLSDHMEVIYDLDTEAKAAAQEMGLTITRAKTVGTHPTFIKMLRALIIERMTQATERPSLGDHGPSHDLCPANCCPSGRPTTRPR